MSKLEKVHIFNSLREILKKAKQAVLSTEIIPSEKNGSIKIIKCFNSRDVMVGGCYQSGPYIVNLLKKMLDCVPRKHKVKTILMIGLGGGEGIEVLYKKYPTAHIVTIEHDEVMVEISKKLIFSKIKFTPEIIIKDASEAINSLISLDRKFDIVILDLYNGTAPAPLMYSTEFIFSLSKVLAKSGYLLANFYWDEKTLAPVLEKFFSFSQSVKYRLNRMRVYRHFGEGKIGDVIPEGLINKEQSFLFISSIIYPKPTKITGGNGGFGLCYSLGPLAAESYACDTMPILEHFRGLRLIVWSPVSQIKPQKGWVRNLLSSSGFQEGFVRLVPSYYNNWSHHALRHRKKWLAETQYKIFEASIDEFEESYNASKKLSKSLRNLFMASTRAHMVDHPGDVYIYLVKDFKININIAGLIVIDYPDINQSVHKIAFMSQEAQKTSVGYGLIDKWYEQALERGIEWLNFGFVWKKGDPKEWQGYSLFKKQFGLHLVRRPRNYFKMTFSLRNKE